MAAVKRSDYVDWLRRSRRLGMEVMMTFKKFVVDVELLRRIFSSFSSVVVLVLGWHRLRIPIQFLVLS